MADRACRFRSSGWQRGGIVCTVARLVSSVVGENGQRASHSEAGDRFCEAQKSRASLALKFDDILSDP